MTVPMMDLLIRNEIKEGLKFLGDHPEILDKQFRYASTKTMNDIKTLITRYNIKVESGYPYDPITLPCIVVMIESEEEVPFSLGDGLDQGYEHFGLDDTYVEWDPDTENRILANAQIRARIRCEIRSDNPVITSFLYSIIKYILLSKRHFLEQEGLMLSSLSGGDLEPMGLSDVVFSYRRVVILSCEYEIGYTVDDRVAGDDTSQFDIGTTIDDVKIDLKERNDNGESKKA